MTTKCLSAEEGHTMRLHNRKALEAASLARFTAFAKKEEEETITVALPDDLSTLSDEELEEITANAVAAFNEIRPNDDVDLNADQIATLEQLAEAKVALDGEKARRNELAKENKAKAAELAAKMNTPEPPREDEADDKEVEGDEQPQHPQPGVDDAAEVVAEAEKVTSEAAEEKVAVTASAKKSYTPISVPKLKARQTPAELPTAKVSPIKAALGLATHEGGAALSMEQLADAFATVSESARRGPVEAARRANGRFSQKHVVAHIEKPVDPRAIVGKDGDANAAIAFATNEKALKGGSLVAAGGWCAPSETLYDMCQLEGTEGLYSLPEVVVNRGGLRWTLGPDWADIFADDLGFCFTEAEDETGTYSGGPDTPKPCNVVPCPDFTEQRLDVCGICIQAGILMNRAYPEAVNRYISGALTAHAHKMATRVLAEVIAGSTAVTPTGLTNGTGAASPILSAIELQVEDMRYRYRMPFGTSFEAIFPHWVLGVIRADLSRRQGVDLISVTDAQIIAWFRQRGINPQFIYNFDNLGTLGTGALVWPATLRFVIYPAGTWVKGGADLITLSMLHDSTLNENNNFTAIFTEEGWMVMKMCHMSRVVTVPVCANGNTHSGSAIACA